MKKFNAVFLGLLVLAQFLFAQKSADISFPPEIDFKSSIEKVRTYSNESLLNSNVANKLSPMSEQLLLDLKNSNSIMNLTNKKNYVLSKINNITHVSGMIRIKNQNDVQELKKIGAKIGTIAGNIITFKIALEQFEALVNSDYYNYLQIDEPVKSKMDKVIPEIKADKVHLGTDLPKAFTGEDVVIGILDGGFDYTHPNFYNNTMTKTRIVRVWEQQYEEGTPPAGYDYGTEYKTQDDIIHAITDDTYGSHGSHVAGIAAGSGNLTQQGYKGVAPSSELVFVSLMYDDDDDYSTGQSSVIDGISYVFKYAESVGKPAVINMSLGTHIGPHDGSSLFDQACDALTGPGKILVGAAGNEGEIPLHISKKLTSNANYFSTFVEQDYYGEAYPQAGMIDIWGEPGDEFCVIVSLVNLLTQEIVNTDNLCTSIDGTTQKKIKGSDDDLSISLFATTSEFNSRPRIFLYLYNESSDIIILTVSSNNATVNLWNHGMGSGNAFSSIGAKEFTDGDNAITVGEIGGTGKNIITVGSHVTRNKFTSIEGNQRTSGYLENRLTDFSSRGPTVDGRIKPEITAPGSYVISSANSYDYYMFPEGPYRDEVVSQITINGTHHWPFAAFEGTSMSAPVVAGAVALLLQYYPLLTPEQIKTVLKLSATKDGHTGSIPASGSNNWGWGKLNIHSAMTLVPTEIKSRKSENGYTIFPNPTTGNFIISFSEIQTINLIVSDIFGNEIINTEYYSEDVINLDNFPNGIYFLKLIDKNNVYYDKLIINK